MGARDARACAGAVARARRLLHDDLRTSDRTPLHAGRSCRDRRRPGHRRPWSFSLHTRHSCHRLPRQAVDAAAICRVRYARGNQPPLPGAPQGGRHRPERGVRSADADGSRSGPRALAWRGREVRRQRHVAGRHGDAVRRHRARRHHVVDDDQFAGGHDLCDVSGRRGKAGGRVGHAGGHDSERHPERVHRTEGIHLSAATIDADHHGHLRVLLEGKCRDGTRFR